MLSPSWRAISELSLLYHYGKGDSLTPSYPCYPVLLIWFGSQYKKVRVFTKFWLSTISELKHYLRAILLISLLQRWFSNSELSLLSYFVYLVLWASRRKLVLWPIFDKVLSPSGRAISELSLLYHYGKDDSLAPSYPCYPILLIWFWEPVKENSCFHQFLTKCYLQAEELSPSYLCQITIAEVIL